MVPYLGLWPKDITSIEEIPTITANNHINVFKMRNLYKFIHQLRTYQNNKYRIDVNQDIYNYLKNPKVRYHMWKYERNFAGMSDEGVVMSTTL